MNFKVFSYIIAGVGLIGLFISTEKVKSSLPLIKSLPTTAILIPAMIAVGVGIILMMSDSKGGNRKDLPKDEVPIYQGKKIVGYRKH